MFTPVNAERLFSALDLFPIHFLHSYVSSLVLISGSYRENAFTCELNFYFSILYSFLDNRSGDDAVINILL